LKDLVLITLLLGALIGFWYVYNQNKSSTLHLKRMMRDMEGLQKAETAYEDLQVYIFFIDLKYTSATKVISCMYKLHYVTF